VTKRNAALLAILLFALLIALYTAGLRAGGAGESLKKIASARGLEMLEIA